MRCLPKLAVAAALLLAPTAAAPVAGEVPLPTYATFAVAGLSGMTAWLVVHPGKCLLLRRSADDWLYLHSVMTILSSSLDLKLLSCTLSPHPPAPPPHAGDVIKARMQLEDRSAAASGASPGPLQVARAMVHEEGAMSLYGGLSAGLLRQATYTTLRLGLYDLGKRLALELIELVTGEPARGAAGGAAMRFVVGALSGAAASFLSCPVEVCLVRMQGDGKLPKAARRNYKSIFDALIRIGREEGLTTYWTGAGTTMIRAMVVSITQIATYDQVKELLEGQLAGTALHAAAGVAAAIVFSTTSMPFDTVKTRVQQGGSAQRAAKRVGTFGAIAQISREEGVSALWRGFPPYLTSKGILTVLLFIIKEKYTELARTLLAGRKAHAA
ncbi:mitochondrial carrier domain-containing protein [Tribonema minus]|uniref:Mitochondrial carrier domain-containing protein n=1 Tax=Tribonema minus TaxID=303371 RepID=A0A835ZCT1_9STRA|nr:mitochondrial carrier domain-containing protein [Tribonema minus]